MTLHLTTCCHRSSSKRASHRNYRVSFQGCSPRPSPDCPTGNSRMRAMRKLPVVPLCRRPAVLLETPNQHHLRRVPFPQEGRFAVVTDVGSGMRWTLRLCVDERSLKRTAKSCGSGAPKQALRSRRCSRVSRVTVATKRWSPRRARISRKPLRGECRMFPVPPL